MIKNIIFDFDGVLVDSEILAAKAFSQLLKQYGYSISQNDIVKFAGKKTYQVVEILAEKYSIKEKEDFFKKVMNLCSSIYNKELECVIGAFEYIQNSKRNLFIGSNSLENRVLEGLKIVNLINNFKKSNIYTFDMVKYPKPSPDIYLKILTDHDIKLEETIVIEDSAVGTQAGVSAGLKVIGLTAGKHWFEERSEDELYNAGATYVINDYNSLDNILISL